MGKQLPDEYLWIPIISGVYCVAMGFGSGANDVGNSFGSSVGAGVLSVRWALCLAMATEFLGAITVGASVVNCIKEEVVELSRFDDDPEILMYALSCAMFAASCWLIIASKLSLPISTTQCTVGSILAVVMVADGFDGIQWRSVLAIAFSWIVSPLAAGLFSFIVFWLLRKNVLKQDNALQRAKIIQPIMVFIIFLVNSFVIIYRGVPDLETIPADVSIGISLAIAFVCTTIFLWVSKRFPIGNQLSSSIDSDSQIYQTLEEGVSRPGNEPKSPAYSPIMNKRVSTRGSSINNHVFGSNLKEDITNFIVMDENVFHAHQNAENFDENVESSFQHLQVLVAILDSFAHGANNIANCVGPLAMILDLYQESRVDVRTEIAIWEILLAMAGVALGLYFYGHNTLAVLGVKICKITPSRGVAIEFSSSTVTLVASRLGFPISTTYCQVLNLMAYFYLLYTFGMCRTIMILKLEWIHI
eukprot:TRINITY_DN2207_c0_g1_i10.p1 TRINITY_DN2207_c0_g1~~TRINITY_DN2207_c0_g1_i10.p1  ORF type:complete len:473 (+),score=74.35 TRINITY_DN2207_c0_g1_i10:63-1481(+)